LPTTLSADKCARDGQPAGCPLQLQACSTVVQGCIKIPATLAKCFRGTLLNISVAKQVNQPAIGFKTMPMLADAKPQFTRLSEATKTCNKPFSNLGYAVAVTDVIRGTNSRPLPGEQQCLQREDFILQ